MPQAFQSNGYGYFPAIIINPWPGIDTPFNPFAILVKSLMLGPRYNARSGWELSATACRYFHAPLPNRKCPPSATNHLRKRPGSFKQYVRSDIIRQRMDNMGVTILLENSISGILCKCFQGSRIGMRQYGIFIRSTCRSFPCCNVKETQSPEVGFALRSLL